MNCMTYANESHSWHNKDFSFCPRYPLGVGEPKHCQERYHLRDKVGEIQVYTRDFPGLCGWVIQLRTASLNNQQQGQQIQLTQHVSCHQSAEGLAKNWGKGLVTFFFSFMWLGRMKRGSGGHRRNGGENRVFIGVGLPWLIQGCCRQLVLQNPHSCQFHLGCVVFSLVFWGYI